VVEEAAPLVRHRKADELFAALFQETENVFQERTA
jgi:hypothetical protein